MATEHLHCLDPEQFLAARIVAVDDQPGNIRLLEALLGEAGYRHLTGLTDPTLVLETLDTQNVDLLLLDMRMPVLDGLSVLALLQEEIHRNGLQVIVLTAETERDSRLQALARGARDFITKPFDNEELLCRIHNALETRFLPLDRAKEAERLEAMVRERTAQLAETQFELVRCLARAGEFRDSDTGSHILRVSIGCRMLAEAAGLSAHQVELIRYASMMHDIGKIGVADRILLKPMKLTPDEFEEIKTHCQYGVDIIGNHPADVTQMAPRHRLHPPRMLGRQRLPARAARRGHSDRRPYYRDYRRLRCLDVQPPLQGGVFTKRSAGHDSRRCRRQVRPQSGGKLPAHSRHPSPATRRPWR